MNRGGPRTLAGAIAEGLKARGVSRIFGIPGGGSSLPLIEAAGRAGLDFVLTRTETAAAIMASVTGELGRAPGVMLAGVGPGATSAVNGAAYAHLERAPLIVLTDGPAASAHQALDQNALFRPISKHQGRLNPAEAPGAFEDALTLALTPPFGPVQFDLTVGDATAPVGDVAPAPRPGAVQPSGEAISAATALLANSRRPVVVAGLEARHGAAPAALRALADALGCPVLTTYKASGALPAAHPGFAGLFTGAVAEGDLMRDADLIVLFGFDAIEKVPGPWLADCPVLELSPAETLSPPAAPDCRVFGPLADIVGALRLTASDWTPQKIAAHRRELLAKLAMSGDGHTAQSIVETCARVAPNGARLTVDSGAHMFAAMAFWPADQAFGVLKSNGLSTMGFALPAAIASALEQPARPVFAITGDGGLTMCLPELLTAATNDCDITVIVVNDAALSLIGVKQLRQQYASSGVLAPDVDFAACARTLGCHAWRVAADGDLGAALAEAARFPGPKLIDVVANPSGYADQLERLRG